MWLRELAINELEIIDCVAKIKHVISEASLRSMENAR